MDWSVFARTNTPHIREYHEETQAVYWIVIDMTAGMQRAQYGDRPSKAGLLREMTGLLGLLILKDQFKVGSVILGPQSSLTVFPPKSTVQSLHAMLKELEKFAKQICPPILDPSTVPPSFDRLEKLIHRGQHVFLISDFLNLPFYAETTANPNDCLNGLDERLSKALAALGRLSQKAELVSFFMVDPLEKEGLTKASSSFFLSDPETMDYALWPANNPDFQKKYQTAVQHMHDRLQSALSRFGICIEASTAESPLEILHRLFLQTRFKSQALSTRGVRS
jgi:uncharacterized protein (DUF58 family)